MSLGRHHDWILAGSALVPLHVLERGAPHGIDTLLRIPGLAAARIHECRSCGLLGAEAMLHHIDGTVRDVTGFGADLESLTLDCRAPRCEALAMPSAEACA